MPTMNVSLTDKLAAFVEHEVETGDYASASEVVRDALRLLEGQREEYKAKLEALRAAIQIGEDEFARGECSEIDMDEIVANVLKRQNA